MVTGLKQGFSMSISPTLAMAGPVTGVSSANLVVEQRTTFSAVCGHYERICTFLRLSHSAAILPCVFLRDGSS